MITFYMEIVLFYRKKTIFANRGYRQERILKDWLTTFVLKPHAFPYNIYL